MLVWRVVPATADCTPLVEKRLVVGSPTGFQSEKDSTLARATTTRSRMPRIFQREGAKRALAELFCEVE
jgi:hypothetical protein